MSIYGFLQCFFLSGMQKNTGMQMESQAFFTLYAPNRKYRFFLTWRYWPGYDILCFGFSTDRNRAFSKPTVGFTYLNCSVCELETQILLAGDLDLIEKGELGTTKKKT